MVEQILNPHSDWEDKFSNLLEDFSLRVVADIERPIISNVWKHDLIQGWLLKSRERPTIAFLLDGTRTRLQIQ